VFEWGQLQMIDCGDGTPDTALLYLEAAIGILDSCSAPPEIAAHADLARARLGDWLVSLNAAGAVPDVFAGNARQDFASH
jgi:hypothetical protein